MNDDSVSRLKELKQKIKEIEAEIRSLEYKSVYTDSMRAELYCSKESGKNVWNIGFKTYRIETTKMGTLKPIIRGYNRREVVEALPKVISELEELLRKINAEMAESCEAKMLND